MELEEDFTSGEGWLDDDGALESFLQEDALLDAIRNAPDMSHEIPSLEEYNQPGTSNIGAQMRGHSAQEGLLPSSHRLATATACSSSATSNMAGGDPLDGMILSGPTHGGVGYRGDAMQRFEIEANAGVGPKERRSDIERGRAGEGLAPTSRSKAPTSDLKARPVKTFPWRGAAVAVATLFWMLVWGPDFFEPPAQEKLLPTPKQRDPQIRMPMVDEDSEDELAAAVENATATRRGSIGVERSSRAALSRNASAYVGGSANTSREMGGYERAALGRKGSRRGGNHHVGH